MRTKQTLEKGGQANPTHGAGQHIGGVVGAQIDAAEADEQGDGIKKRAQFGIIAAEQPGAGKGRGAVAGRKGVTLGHCTDQDGLSHLGKGTGATKEGFERKFDRRRRQPEHRGKTPERLPALGPAAHAVVQGNKKKTKEPAVAAVHDNGYEPHQLVDGQRMGHPIDLHKEPGVEPLER